MISRNLVHVLLAVALFVIAAPVSAQDYRTYFYYRVTAGDNETLTVQQPATGMREVAFKGAVVSSATACTATVEIGGALATGTPATPKKLNRKADAPKSLIFAASNVGVGDVFHIYDIPASSAFALGALDGSGAVTATLPSGSQSNFSLRTTCPTGAKITVAFSERP